MLISTFELLLKSQLPQDLPPAVPQEARNLSRNVIQGYFLTIANLSSFDLVLSLVFTTRLTPPRNLDDIIAFLDTSGNNISGSLSVDNAAIAGNKFRFSPLFLAAGATGLFIIQPNIVAKPELLNSLDFEVRGYAEIFLSSLAGPLTDINLQVTPEHRGTFFGDLSQDNITDRGLDQIAYSLPVQNGGLFTLSTSS
ncbi:hypothetical protein [Gloeocapsopsis dulcis]|uniref:Uncharacterized protein n=1 Tax=Gloeocapsopsis dulcis AAB1 = 1H9 TaxID=1433147 RepID=A0A6N8FV00_9CHRO|nr:hypothetical protein [Gloeocapsopsis dulcis]MUL35977.1 hypothetical protein [Gloeocapsopsis dulcis AAB1 = 1H9]WNN88230.1 hypothetical protein P0S91_18300 [Gloeocapsopsis dulcis]